MLKLPTPTRWIKGFALAAIVVMALAALSACAGDPVALANSVNSASTTKTTASITQPDSAFSFKLVPSPGITSCLPKASGNVTITPGSLNDLMKVSVKNLAPNTGYDLFVLEIPNKPFGIAWYQSDLQTDATGAGSVSVRGIFNKETFSVSTGGPTVKFSPTHQYHLGLWFNDPQVPFNLGCEPGQTSPIVTPFNGEQHAGIQVLNTSNFPDNAGPLSQVS
jgi:hypothetical protein